MVITAAIAIIYALPPEVTTLLSAVSVVTVCLTTPLLVIPLLSRMKRENRPAKIERALIAFLTRTSSYAIIFFVVVMTAQSFRLLADSVANGI